MVPDWCRRGLMDVVRKLSPELLEYLEKVDWGFDTGVRYRILDRRPMLEALLPHGEFRLLLKNHRIIGTVFSLHKKIGLGIGLLIDAQYDTLLSVLPQERGQGYAKALIQSSRSDAEKPKIQYAYVEEQNIPSASAFKSLGYEIAGRFLATTFNRLKPTLSARAALISAADAASIKAALVDMYREHGLNDVDMSFDQDHYWILHENGRPVVGAQIKEERWSITSMPGAAGLFAVHGLPYLPLLNRILNPRVIPLLKLSHPYVPEGREKELMELTMHVTCVYRKKLALAYLDPRSSVYRRLKENLRFGLFNPLFETPVNIWARFQNIAETEIVAFKKCPVVISPLDIS